MKAIKKIYMPLLLLGCMLAGCGGDFYSYYNHGDIWRIPLIEPYELINTTETQVMDSPVWFFFFKTLKKSDGEHPMGINVSMVNVDKGFIYGYADGISHPCPPFLINTRTKEEKVYETMQEWETDVRKNGLDPAKVYKAWDIFPKFKENGILPWSDQIKNSKK